jgi:membrane protein required for colicin V production
MSSLPINVTDLIIILVLVLSAVFAFFRGFVHETLAVGSWIGSAVVTLYAFPYVQPKARAHIPSPLIADLVAGIAIFLIVLVLLSVLTRVLSRRVRDSSLGPLDRSLGLIFGVVRGAVLVCIAWLMIVWILPREDMPSWITEARGLPLVERGGTLIARLIPEQYQIKPAEGTAGAQAGKVAGQAYDQLLAPATKDITHADKPGYKNAERDAMQQLIEAATRNGAAEERTDR